MTTYEISAARLLDSAGQEFLVISIPPEHYGDPEIRNRYFELLGVLEMPLVLVSATSESEWSIRAIGPHLLKEMASVKVETLGWHRMPVICEAVPWEV